MNNNYYRQRTVQTKYNVDQKGKVKPILAEDITTRERKDVGQLTMREGEEGKQDKLKGKETQQKGKSGKIMHLKLYENCNVMSATASKHVTSAVTNTIELETTQCNIMAAATKQNTVTAVVTLTQLRWRQLHG